MDCFITFQKKNKTWGHRTNSLSRGFNPIPIGSCIIQCKKFRNDHFGRFDDAILLSMKQKN